jgi:hypothetical protein
MKFLLIIGHDDDFGPSHDLIGRITEWNRQMRDRKILEDSNPLKPWQQAKTLRKRDGKLGVTSGSFSESRERISAYALIDCKSESEAIAIASSHPMVEEAVIEVRPIWENIAQI